MSTDRGMSVRIARDYRELVNDHSAQDAYLGRVHGLRIAVCGDVSAESLAQVDSLIEHGEPAEGVCSLAWALHNAQVAVPAWVNETIRDLTEGMVDPVHMPPRLPEVD
jgi:hypothetical protein